MKYVILLILSFFVYSQENIDSIDTYRKNFIGLNLLYDFASANGSLTNANYPDYVDYETSLNEINSGIGVSIFYISNHKLSDKKYIDKIKLGLALTYRSVDLNFRSIETFRSIFQDNNVVPLIETNNVDVTINTFSINPNINYQLNNDTSTVFLLSITPSINLNSTSTSSRHAEIENSGVLYGNGTNRSGIDIDEFEINGVTTSLKIGLLGLTDLNFFSSKIPFGKYNLSYGINYDLPFGSVLLDDLPINVFSFYVGCGITF